MTRYGSLTSILLVGIFVTNCLATLDEDSGLKEGWKDDDWANEMDKRSIWRKFQGSWGKRDFTDLKDGGNEEFVKRARWANIHGSWGKRDDLEGEQIEDAPEMVDNGAIPFKRTWTKFSGTWGKRPYRTIFPRSPNWSSLRGSWGKRSGVGSQETLTRQSADE